MMARDTHPARYALRSARLTAHPRKNSHLSMDIRPYLLYYGRDAIRWMRANDHSPLPVRANHDSPHENGKGDIMAKAESCINCVYSCWDRNQAMWTMGVGVPTRPTCANHPDSLGRNRPTPGGGVCRNYRPRPAEPGRDAKQIPLGDGYYAYVDAADYEWLSQWTWYLHNGYAARHGVRRADLHAPRDHAAAQRDDRGSQTSQ